MTMVNKLLSHPEFIGLPVESVAVTLDGSSEKCAHIQQIVRAGNIAAVSFYNAAITTGDTIKASIQTVDTSTGFPTGTIWATATGNKAFGTVAVSTGETGWSTITFGEVAPVTQDDLIAIVFEYNSYAAGNMRFYANIVVGGQSIPYAANNLTGSWAMLLRGGLGIVIGYSDGYYAQTNSEGVGAAASLALSQSTDPDEIGNYFQVPFTMRAYGMCVYADIDYDCTMSILAADNTVLASGTAYAGARNTTGRAMLNMMFSASYTLQPSTWYRMIITPTTTSNVSVYYISVHTAAAMDVLDGGILCYATSRNNKGAWTDLTTRRFAMSLLIDQIDIPAGGIYMPAPRMIGV